jgi:hypothetical protein
MWIKFGFILHKTTIILNEDGKMNLNLNLRVPVEVDR